MGKMIIKKSICRKLNTAQFEQLDINLEIEQEIEFETEQEKIEKTREITNFIKKDWLELYNETTSTVCPHRSLNLNQNVERVEKKTDYEDIDAEDLFY